MFSQCNAKLQVIKDLLVELLAELDVTLEDVRQRVSTPQCEMASMANRTTCGTLSGSAKR